MVIHVESVEEGKAVHEETHPPPQRLEFRQRELVILQHNGNILLERVVIACTLGALIIRVGALLAARQPDGIVHAAPKIGACFLWHSQLLENEKQARYERARVMSRLDWFVQEVNGAQGDAERLPHESPRAQNLEVLHAFLTVGAYGAGARISLKRLSVDPNNACYEHHRDVHFNVGRQHVPQ